MSDVKSSIYDEVLAEITKYPLPTAFKFNCEIDIEGFILKPYRIINFDVSRMFHTNYADEIVIELALSEGDYARYVYPQRHKLQVQLTRTMIGEVEELELPGLQPTTRRFSAILQDTKNMDLQGMPSTSGDNTLVTIQLQLLELAPEILRLQSIGACFSQAKPSDVIKTILGIYSKKLKLPKEAAVRGIDVYEPDNDTVRQHIVIPDGTELLDFPGYIQKKCGGIYNSGAGLYFHSNLWWVFPYLDDTRYQKEEYVLDVFVIPPNRMPEADRTYRAFEKRLQILSTGDNYQTDSSDLDNLRFGNGVVFSSSKEFFNNFSSVEGNVAKTNKELTTSRFVLEKRDNPLQYTPFSDVRFTDNIAYELSKLRARSTQMVSVVWNNARPELLYPGMPVKLYYGKESGSREIYGCLAAVREHTKPNLPGMTVERYKSTCTLTFVFASE